MAFQWHICNGIILGMHDIGFFPDIQYADIQQHIWPISDTDVDISTFFPHLVLVIIKSPLS